MLDTKKLSEFNIETIEAYSDVETFLIVRMSPLTSTILFKPESLGSFICCGDSWTTTCDSNS